MRWQAWEVVPVTAERRAQAERRFGSRDRVDRRVRDEQARVRVGHGMEQGWLVFESPTEKRRVHPIPKGWDALPDEALVELLRAGTVA